MNESTIDDGFDWGKLNLTWEELSVLLYAFGGAIHAARLCGLNDDDAIETAGRALKKLPHVREYVRGFQVAQRATLIASSR
jgi:hypothetical protein